MSIHAAANIATAVDNFRDRGYAEFGGIILNRRNVKNEEEKVAELAEDLNSRIIGPLDRSDLVLDAEELGKTVLEAFPDSDMAGQYRRLAEQIMESLGEKTC
jgi:nitrogenase iron protein NifH